MENNFKLKTQDEIAKKSKEKKRIRIQNCIKTTLAENETRIGSISLTCNLVGDYSYVINRNLSKLQLDDQSKFWIYI